MLINLLRKGLGKKVIGKKIPYRRWIDELNPELEKRVIYGGLQEDSLGRAAYHTFTTKDTRATFMFPISEDINLGVMEGLARIEKGFGKTEQLYHATPEINIEEIRSFGFSLGKFGKGIGPRRGEVEALGVSLGTEDLMKAYLRASKYSPFPGTKKVEKLATIKVTANIKNPLDLTKIDVKLKDLTKHTDDTVSSLAADIAVRGEAPGSRASESTALLRKYFDALGEGEVFSAQVEREIGNIRIKASEMPDSYLKSILKSRTPKGVTEELQRMGYDSIQFGDELKVFDPTKVRAIPYRKWMEELVP